MPTSDTTILELQIGDIVALRETYVDRHSWYAKAMPLARGKVTAIHRLDRVTFADIEWDRPGLPKRINVKYLRIENAVVLGG